MSALRPGLCSVTFRDLPAEAVARLAAEAGLAGVEWGGDVHAPPGDVARARRIAAVCGDLGLGVPSYGAYLRCEDAGEDRLDAALDVAEALGARTLRVWAGRRGSAEADAAHRARVAETLAGHVDAAAARGLRVALEWHPNTLTDTREAAMALIAATGRAGLATYWQRRDGQGLADATADLDAIGARLAHVHVFWWTAARERLPLADGAAFWRALTPRLAAAPGPAPRWALMEFVRDGDVARFRADAATLLSLLAETADAEPRRETAQAVHSGRMTDDEDGTLAAPRSGADRGGARAGGTCRGA